MVSTHSIAVAGILLLHACTQAQEHSTCRFSPSYTQDELRANSTAFENDIFFWESGFSGANGVGYNPKNGMTYDGVILNQTTGIANISERHPFSAASKESLHVMILAHAIAGDPRAMTLLSPNEPAAAPSLAAEILGNKLQSYITFNQSYPGFGGFLPWFLANGTELQPTSDWVNRVPALDNSELFWAVYGLVEVLQSSNSSALNQLGLGWEGWLNYTKQTALSVSKTKAILSMLTSTPDILPLQQRIRLCSRRSKSNATPHLPSSKLLLRRH